MWFEYWESKGIPAPKFEIGDRVEIILEAYKADPPSVVTGIILDFDCWKYQLSSYQNLKGVYFEEMHLKKAIPTESSALSSDSLESDHKLPY